MHTYQTADDPLLPMATVNVNCMKRRLRRIHTALIILLLLLIVMTACFMVYYVKYRYERDHRDRQPPKWQQSGNSQQQLETFELNAVAADASVCSTIGAYTLNALGGNAIDAAVAAMLCIGVCNAHSAGVGGGSFLIFYNSKTRSASAFDFRETAPASASQNMFNDLAVNASRYGGLSVATPGEVAGLAAVHSRHGRLSWRAVVQPTAKLLRVGFRVAEPLAHAMKSEFPDIPDTAPYDTLKKWMINPETQKLYRFGDLLKDEQLAATMDRIAEDPHSFYNGSLAREIVKEVADAGGILTLEDLQKYTVSEPPILNVSLNFANMRLLSMPPPSSGAVLSFIMKLIDGFKPTPKVKNTFGDYVTFLHRFVESLKFAYAKRSALGDAAFVDVRELVANLTSDAFADEIRKEITDCCTHGVNYYGPSFSWKPDSGTTHLSLVDTEGNAVAVTSTINTYFGSWVKGAKTGILYNNEMDDFSVPNRTNSFDVPPSPSNFISPGKRPMSSMAPSMLTDASGRLQLVTGGAGGTLITSSVAYTMARYLYLNESVKAATDAFRLHHQLVPNEIAFNSKNEAIPQEVKSDLEKRGHRFVSDDAISVVESVAKTSEAGGWQASGDFRKPSRPDGN